jgi:hypothetical protein
MKKLKETHLFLNSTSLFLKIKSRDIGFKEVSGGLQ